MEGLMALSEAGNFAEQLHNLQKQLTAIREDLDAIRHPRVRRESPVVPGPSTHINRKSWTEEWIFVILLKMEQHWYLRRSLPG